MATKTQKRYQFFGKNGKEWTKWFDCNDTSDPVQLKGKLKNEYRTISIFIPFCFTFYKQL